MSDFLLIVLFSLIAGLISGPIGFGIKVLLDQRSLKATINAANQQINMAQERSQEILLEAKEKSLQIRLDSEKEINEEKRKIHEEQSKIDSLTAQTKTELSELSIQKLKVLEQIKFNEECKEELILSKDLYTKKIEEASEISYEDAKKILLEEAEQDLEHEIGKVEL